MLKQENLIDRLTREKLSYISDLENYKKKCDSIDLDTQQVYFLNNLKIFFSKLYFLCFILIRWLKR